MSTTSFDYSELPFSSYGTVSDKAESITFSPLEYCGVQEFDGDDFLESRR